MRVTSTFPFSLLFSVALAACGGSDGTATGIEAATSATASTGNNGNTTSSTSSSATASVSDSGTSPTVSVTDNGSSTASTDTSSSTTDSSTVSSTDTATTATVASTTTTSTTTATSTPAATSSATAYKATVFFSGHSLMDDPITDNAAAIASAFGKQAYWNQQIYLGSPIRARTRGSDMNDASFSGYRNGKNRDSSTNMDVVSELRNPQTTNGQRYDTLVLTERNDIASTLQWEDTVRYARHFHERLIEGNAGATTYLYHSWYGVSDKSNPTAWIAYERAAVPVWQCVASRINKSLAKEGRSDRMQYMPAGLALVNLVERATQGYVAGVTGSSTVETMNRLFTDDVHLTSMGKYYMSLVSYASVFRSAPSGAWAPSDVSADAAKSLQDLAWATVSSYYASATDPSMESCQATMRDNFCAAFYTYSNNLSAMGSCVSYFSQSSQSNPFVFDAANDASYWFPAPQ